MALIYFEQQTQTANFCVRPGGLALLGQPRRLSLCEQLLCGVAAGSDAGGDADTSVGVAGKSEAGQLVAQTLNAVEAVEMPDAVLRHGRLPFVDAGEERLRTQAEDLLQFVAYDSDDLLVGEGPDFFRIPSGKETAQQGAVLGS